MIKVKSITITEFRGIRNLTLQIGERNFAICGANGTGKSGVVDSLEFALTGNISRLSGAGRGDVSVKSHGPHVDFRGDPQKAKVSLTVFIPSLNIEATIERSPKNPALPVITPNTPQVEAVFLHAKNHPEIVLSRRELIQYVLATPGDRAREVQALLHVEEIESVRGVLQRIANQLKNKITPTESQSTQAKQSLLKVLGITDFSKTALIEAANLQRAILGLPLLTDLNPTISLKEGILDTTKPKPQRVVKAVALADMAEVKSSLDSLSSLETRTTVAEALEELRGLEADPLLVKGVSAEDFYKKGLSLIEEDLCPLCDADWNMEDLRLHVQHKVDRLATISQKRKALTLKLRPVVDLLNELKNSLTSLLGHGRLLNPPAATGEVQALATAYEQAATSISAFLPLNATITSLEGLPVISPEFLTQIAAIESAVKALPEPTKQDAAKELLIVAQERLETVRAAQKSLKEAREEHERARIIFETYVSTSDAVLKGIYDAVQSKFAEFYRFVNDGDESEFEARLVPSMGKLDFDVDFYGRGYFPPGAYHSEGHQDGMGLCLYLALMQHLHGEGFTFAVLDDVLMSVDVGHRREVCRLLKKFFPKTQFVMTTHDQVWLKHMKTEALIGGRVQFKSWSVDSGPKQWDDSEDVWGEIASSLAKNDVREASAKLRHFLEYISAELCDRLQARVPYRGDGQYQLGELLPPAINRLKELYKKAKEVANSWNLRDKVAAISEVDNAFSTLCATSSAEQWQVNSAVHYNNWANMVKEDFAPVVEAFKALLEGFTCSSCQGHLYVSPGREDPECLRCECNQVNFNLKKKPK